MVLKIFEIPQCIYQIGLLEWKLYPSKLKNACENLFKLEDFEEFFKSFGLVPDLLESLFYIQSTKEIYDQNKRIFFPGLYSLMVLTKQKIDEFYMLSPEQMKEKANELLSKMDFSKHSFKIFENILVGKTGTMEFTVSAMSSKIAEERQRVKLNQATFFQQQPMESIENVFRVLGEDQNLDEFNVIISKCIRLPAFQGIVHESALKILMEKNLKEQNYVFQKNLMDFPYFFDFCVDTPEGKIYIIV